MSFRIAGKSEIDYLLNNRQNKIINYEIHLKTIEDFDMDKVKRLLKKIQILSVHQPKYISVNGSLKGFNLLSDTQVGELSRVSLESTLYRCELLGIKKVVLHGARYDHNLLSEEKATEKLVSILERTPLIKLISLENDVLWYNTDSTSSLPLVIDSRVIKSIVDELNLSITMDVEHIILTNLYLSFKKYFSNLMTLSEFEIKFNKWIRSATEQKIEDIYLSISNFINTFRKKINNIHINGSDWFNYYYDKSLPLFGEHLPIGYNGNGLKDRIDYSRIFKILSNFIKQKNLDIIMEISVRDNKYNYFDEIERSKKYLERNYV